jgi:hypothetical protein
MTDGRANRKAKVIRFLNSIELDRYANFSTLVSTAKKLQLEGFENIYWDATSWTIVGGRLVKLAGKNTVSTTFNFAFSPKLEGSALPGKWSELCKALLVLRFHRGNQAAPNQRTFIIALGYVANAAANLRLNIETLNFEALDDACRLISKHYSEGTAYNLHKAVAEVAASLDANGLCRILFQFKYARMRRPESTGGIGQVRLDDPVAADTTDAKILAPEVFQVIGELYRAVPHDHKYRFYVLILALLCCLGRRFSEIALLPYQKVVLDSDGFSYIEYFPRKQSKGDTSTPRRRLYLPTGVVPIATDVFEELDTLCAAARETAFEMHRCGDIDMRFLDNVPDDKHLYAADLLALGVSPTVLANNKWFLDQGYVSYDLERKAARGRRARRGASYTNRAGLLVYCRRSFSASSLRPLHIDQFGSKTYLKDLMLTRHVGLSSGAYTSWVSSQCTHSMLTTFLRYFDDLVWNYASTNLSVDFVSHQFRHTLNTLIDEGGMSDLLQTRWFGRTNPSDTKAYQHTSREKRALMLREDLKAGRVGGQFAEVIRAIPTSQQDAILAVRIKAVHDVGVGLCIHHFSQIPCTRHLQCDAECDDYLYLKNDEAKIDEVKRRYAMAMAARETAVAVGSTTRPSNSVDWVAHNDKRLKTLTKQMADLGVDDFAWREYLVEGQL